MGVSFDLYNAPADKTDMKQWDKDYSLPIDSPNTIMKILQKMYPRIIEWDVRSIPTFSGAQSHEKSHSLLVVDNCRNDNEYIDINLHECSDKKIHMITLYRASPKLCQVIMDAFNLNYLYVMEAGSLIDPKEYKDDWVKI